MSKFHHGQHVQGTINGKTITGSIRTVTRGVTERLTEPEYGVLPEGQLSLAAMVTITESALKVAV